MINNKVTELEKAYFAGFFDGEGCVFINKQDRDLSDRRGVTLQCCDCMELEGESQTVHCESADGQIRCEVCGKIKE